jgi:hypothetical protein
MKKLVIGFMAGLLMILVGASGALAQGAQKQQQKQQQQGASCPEGHSACMRAGGSHSYCLRKCGP